MPESNTKRKELHVFTIDKKVNQYLVKVLTQIIGDQVIIKGFYQNNYREHKDVDLVLTSGEFLVDTARKYYPDTRVLGAKRIINGDNIEKLFSIPSGTKVLVVNHPETVTYETIEALKTMGIKHLKYIPYWKGAKVNGEASVGISSGMLHLCPDHINKRIDIGMRTIAFTTLMEIIQHLKLEKKKLDIFADQYIKVILDNQRALCKTLKKKETLEKNQKQIINHVEQAIILVENQKILGFNPECENLFGISETRAVGKDIQELFIDFPEFLTFYSSRPEKLEEKKTKILDFQGRKLLLTQISLRQAVYDAPLLHHEILIFHEVEKIQELEKEVRAELYYKKHTAKYSFRSILHESPEMKECIRKAKKIAGSDSNVLITGESGTGKELIAQAIHRSSKRKNGPFVAVNFAALPGDLIESELFGYDEGAFTGARKGGNKGLFEQAHGGTIFLDEIADTSLKIQARLLRVLQEREIMRIGGRRILPIDIRVLAATNKDLVNMVHEGYFRKDLYYRLKILPISIPPLRKRRKDIPYLLSEILKKKDPDKRLSNRATEILTRYNWPGNVRELENLMEYLVFLSDHSIINETDLPEDFLDRTSFNSPTEETIEKTMDDEQNSVVDGFVSPNLSIAIMELIYEAKVNNDRIGRRSLLKKLKERDFKLTESKLRTILHHYEKQGLLTPGKTRQGTMLTAKGQQYLGQIGSK